MMKWKLVLALLAGAASLVAGEPSAKPVEPEPKRPLRRILIGETLEIVQALPSPPEAGLVVLSSGLAFLDVAELTKRLAPNENQPIDSNRVTSIGQAIEEFARQRNFPNATVVVPTQNIGEGVVRLILVLKPVTLRHIIVAEGVEAAQKLPEDPAGSFVTVTPALSFVDRTELTKRLAAAENKVIGDRLLAAVAQVVENYVRQESPFATAVIPPQEIGDGTLRIAVTLGKVRNIRIGGTRWFSESLLREKLRIEQGGTLLLSDLDRALGWVNNNPFRRVRVQVDPSSTAGEADLVIAVQERLPLRLLASYDNAGNEIIGEHRFTAAASYGNLWGRDHQASYQFITTDLGPRLFQGHGFDYRVPLRWRHYLQLSGSYLRAKPEFFGGILVRDAENLTGNIRYTVPLRGGDNPAEVYAALDFKRSNNNLAFGGDIVDADNADIFQAIFGGSLVTRDKLGAWAFGASLTASPGNVNSRNRDDAFKTRLGAETSYVYGSVSAQRLLKLPREWDFMSRAIIQRSSANLLSSEQLTIGGVSTVRGIRENVFAGEEGFVFSNELRTPPLNTPVRIGPKQHRGVIETRLIAFYDAAQVYFKHHYPRIDVRTGQQVGWDDDGLRPLASAGVGLRMSLATNFSLSADYGWQLTRVPEGLRSSRGHIRVSLAY